MKSALERLHEYRSCKKKKRTPTPEPEVNTNNENIPERSECRNQQILNPLEIWSIDLLNFWPMKKWRELCALHPFQCWTATACFWITGQLLAAHVRFGLVYFIISSLLLIFLNLGSRADGEPSAYSVFNPGCERLLGQITAEHFERDMLMVRRNVDSSHSQ